MKRSVPTYFLASAVLGMIAMLVMPLPPLVLDTLLAIDLLCAGMVLILSIVIHEPLQFAAFAPILLISTLFRLTLDVCATRLILTHGADSHGVGDLIPAFGAFVLSGRLVVGIIIFAILITIQFVVISSGAGRVAEVAARFTLDALPGKQMAIDAELHAGSIDANVARQRRRLLQREAEFFGAMDGAGKFVKGDAIAALVIVSLNLIGGFVTGLLAGMDPATAIATYAMLAIGNALLTTLPSFLLSTAMGLLVTRVAADGSLGADLAAQLFGRPDVLRVAAGFALVLAAVPALPHLLFLILAVLACLVAEMTARRKRGEIAERTRERYLMDRAARRRPEAAITGIGVDALAIGLGHALVPMLIEEHGEELLDRLGEVRRVLASEIGILCPGVRLRQEPTLAASDYAIFVRGERVARGTLTPDRLLAIASPEILLSLPGKSVTDPVYGMQGILVEERQRDTVLQAGGLLFDAVAILGSHLAEVVRLYAPRLIGRQEIQTLFEFLRPRVPALIAEIGQDHLPLATVVRILHALLEERIWPCDWIALLEILLDAATLGCDERAMLDRLRARFVPIQLRRFEQNFLQPLMIDPEDEVRLQQIWCAPASISTSNLADTVTVLRERLIRYSRCVPTNHSAILCTSRIRHELAAFTRRILPMIPVYAYGELPSEITLQAVPYTALIDNAHKRESKGDLET